MPIYEYECTGCRHRFEVIQKFSDPPKRSCPRCRARVRKLISAPGIQFKGSGWYVTDYARKAATSSGSKDSDQAGDSTSVKADSAKAAGSGTSSGSSTPSPSKTKRARKRATRRTPSRRRRRR